MAAARKRRAEIAEKESDEGSEEKSEDEEIWDVDFIKDMRWKGGVKQFRVRWVDYGSEDDTCLGAAGEHPPQRHPGVPRGAGGRV